jgi:hypothetical protein
MCSGFVENFESYVALPLAFGGAGCYTIQSKYESLGDWSRRREVCEKSKETTAKNKKQTDACLHVT